MVTIEQTRSVCDHCEELTQGVILSAENGDEFSSIQLCNDCAAYFGKEMNSSLITTIESQKSEIEGYKAITELAVKENEELKKLLKHIRSEAITAIGKGTVFHMITTLKDIKMEVEDAQT